MSLVDEILTKSTKLLDRTSSTGSLISRLTRTQSLESLNIPTKECSICATETDTALYPDLSQIPNACQMHCSEVCTFCLKRCIAAAIEDKPIHHIGCPTCDIGWGRRFLERWASLAELEMYDSRRIMRDLETETDFRRCQSRTCASGQLHSGGEAEPMMTCVACGFASCYTHNVRWHAGMSCTEYDDMIKKESEKQKATRIAEEEREYQTTFGKDAKSCPECKVSMFRESGCNIMRCTSCKLSFCWRCDIDMNPIESGTKSPKTHMCPLYDDDDSRFHGTLPATSSQSRSPSNFSSPSPSPSHSPSPSSFSPPSSSSLGRLVSSSLTAAAIKPTSLKQVTLREYAQTPMSDSDDTFPLTPSTPLNPMRLDWENFCPACGTITTHCKHKKGKGRAEMLETNDEEASERRWWKRKVGLMKD